MTPKKLCFIASLGAGLEYYDFIIYGLLASYLSQAFFPTHNSVIALLQTFAIFALGYVVRPLGALLLGSFGDKYGRRKIFLLSLFLMAFATIALGLLPNYQRLGVIAPILLIVVRVLQGLTFSTEVPGLATYLLEYIPGKNRYFYVGLSLSSLSFGSGLGSFIVYLLNHWLSPIAMQSYGWRIPFVLGGMLAIVSFFIRKRLQETPEFLAYVQSRIESHPIKKLFAEYKFNLVIGFGIAFFCACFFMLGVAIPSFVHQFYHYSLEDAYAWNTIGLACSTVALPFFGWCSSQFGRRKLLIVSIIVFILLSPIIFNALRYQIVGLAVFVVLYNLFTSAFANAYIPILALLFPTPVRLTGAALTYNLVYSLAGFTPLLIGHLINLHGVTSFYYWPLILLSFVSLFVVSIYKVE